MNVGRQKLEKELTTHFPLRKTALVLLVVFVSIATNDVELRYDTFIKQNYWVQLLIVGVLSYFSFTEEKETTLFTRLLATLVVVIIFYIFTAPQGAEPFAEDDAFGSMFGGSGGDSKSKKTDKQGIL